jgi:hypothetical protein
MKGKRRGGKAKRHPPARGWRKSDNNEYFRK